MEKPLYYVMYIVLGLIIVSMAGLFVTKINKDEYFKAKVSASELSLVVDAISNFPGDIEATLTLYPGYNIRIEPPCKIELYSGTKIYAKENCNTYQFDKTLYVSTPFIVIKKHAGVITVE